MKSYAIQALYFRLDKPDLWQQRQMCIKSDTKEAAMDAALKAFDYNIWDTRYSGDRSAYVIGRLSFLKETSE